MIYTDTDRLPAYLLDAIDTIEAATEAELRDRYFEEIEMPWDDSGDMDIEAIKASIISIRREALVIGLDDLLDDLNQAAIDLEEIETGIRRKRIEQIAAEVIETFRAIAA